jgi:transposase-like protein
VTVVPMSDELDASSSMNWLAHYLHPNGLVCPHCGSEARRLFRRQKHFPAYRCRDCDGYYTLLTGTVFKKTRQSPTTLVLLVHGITKGEATARLARELGLSHKQLQTLRQRLQRSNPMCMETQLPDAAELRQCAPCRARLSDAHS